MKVIIANNNNNTKNSNNRTSCVGYLQSSEGGESVVLSPAGAGLCKKCLSASGQFKTKINILVYSWGGTVQKHVHHHYPQTTPPPHYNTTIPKMVTVCVCTC